ncbi:MAG: hypothetical protein JXA72_11045 [Bacteroidales bacterium]|nr:hypothetical protein [Bacteroidales bacterium]
MVPSRFLLIFLANLMFFAGLHAQHFKYKAGYSGFFDNREYFNRYVNDQTIFGSRLSGELGYSFDENNCVMVGADYLYEFGSKGEWVAPDFIAYYHGHRNHFGLYLGAFPRHGNIGMPMALMADTFQYFRPVVEGMLIDFKTSRFRHNIWIDWTSRQSATKRETFLLGFSGHYQKGIFLYQHHFVMTHLAHALEHNPDERIRDNAGYAVTPGLDLTGISGLDSLTVYAGVLGSYDRLRGIYDFRFPIGFYGEAEALYKSFGVHGVIYSGDNQFITSGDGFYKAPFYSRADIYYQVSTPAIQGKVQCSFHFLPGVVDLSMSLAIRAQLEGLFRNRQSN